MKKFGYSCLLCFFGLAAGVRGSTLVDFEPPVPGGVTPNDFHQGVAVAAGSELTNQYEGVGAIFSTFGGSPYAALVNLSGQAPSGVNGVGAVNSAGFLDYTADLDIFLVVPGTLTPAVTDFISIQGDEEPIPGDVVFSAYDVNGNLVASGTEPDTAGGTYSLSAAGIHEFRLHSTSGTVAYDNLSIDPPVAPTPGGPAAPEPGTLAMLAAGISVFVGGRLRQRVNAN